MTGVPARLRRLRQLHEHEAVVRWWQARLAPLLAWLTPGRRRGLLALAACYVVVARPLREIAPAVDLAHPGGPLAAALIVALCAGFVGLCYLAARRYAALPALVRARPQVCLHLAFWAVVAARWMAPAPASVTTLVLSGLVLALPFFLWRCGYLLMSGQRGRMGGTRLADHALYLYPAYGGTNTPVGKGLDYLARHEAATPEALARSQLAGVKLLLLATCWWWALRLFAGLVHGEPRRPLAAYGLGLPRLADLIAQGGDVPWATAWAALYAGLVWDVLKLAARGHEVVGVLRLAGFNVFRNTYRPLLAPSVVEFWNRYYYYFKELLVDFFFFPTYLRWFRRHARLRILAATLAAAGLGNLYYHLLQRHGFLLTADLAGLWPWLSTRALYCLLLALGIYVSMLREQRRRGTTAPPAGLATRVRRVAGVWTFFALLSVWSEGSAPFGRRLEFLLALFGLR